jgi:hypothetical protein
MKQNFPTRLIISGSITLSLFAFACQKRKTVEESDSINRLDRVDPSPAATSQPVVSKDFTVRTSMAFPFEIPAHVAMPRLRGSYKSFATSVGVQSRDDVANVDFYVVTDDQYRDFVQGDSGNVLFAASSSHDEHVDVNLPPTMSAPQKYYAVFRNTPGGEAKKAVRADLSIEF